MIITRMLRVLAAATLPLAITSTAVAQCGGVAATASPCGPYVLPGTPGVHEVVMDVSTATGGFTTACGFNVGKAVWFEFTPLSTGLVTFTTCHPSTEYDTVVQVWEDSGDCEFPIRIDALCNDDTPGNDCTNSCEGLARSSAVTFSATAATTYLIEVGAYDNNSAGCPLCLGVRLIVCGGDNTPPVASISAPAALGCVCDSAQLVGTATDPDGSFLKYTVEYRPASTASWTTLVSSTTPVSNGVLANWNTSALARGYYYTRLTVENTCGLFNTAVQTVYVDAVFDTLDVRSPGPGAVVGGLVCLDGTVWDNLCFDSYTADYRSALGGPTLPVDPSRPVYTSAVINDPFATWDTVALAVPDGPYDLEFNAITDCGFMASAVRAVIVDNTPPMALLTEPTPCEFVGDLVNVAGIADDNNLASWVLQYTGGPASSWVTIASGTSPSSGLLATWDTSALPACAYTLRLVVTDLANLNCNSAIHHRTETTLSVNVGCRADLAPPFDVLDIFDIIEYLGQFDAGCP